MSCGGGEKMPLYVNRQMGRIGLVSIAAWGLVWYGVSKGRHLVLYEAFRSETSQQSFDDRGPDQRPVGGTTGELSSLEGGSTRYRSLSEQSLDEKAYPVESAREPQAGQIGAISYWQREGDDWVEITVTQAVQLAEKGRPIYQIDQWNGELIPYRRVRSPGRRSDQSDRSLLSLQ